LDVKRVSMEYKDWKYHTNINQKILIQ
jgi:hypothetical protein